MSISPHDILGVPRDASEEDVRQAYKMLMQRNHPDKNPNDPYAVTRIQIIKEAYDSIIDKPRIDDLPDLKAEEMMRIAVQKVLPHDPECLIESATEALEMRKNDLMNSADDISEAIERMEKKLKSFKKKNEERNVVGTMLMGLIDQAKDAKKNAEEELGFIDRAIELMDDYEDLFEREETSRYVHVTFGGGIGSTTY